MPITVHLKTKASSEQLLAIFYVIVDGMNNYSNQLTYRYISPFTSAVVATFITIRVKLKDIQMYILKTLFRYAFAANLEVITLKRKILCFNVIMSFERFEANNSL